MLHTSVTSKGQLTILKTIRQKSGIKKGSKVSFDVIDSPIELIITKTPVKINQDGFGLLKINHKASPCRF